MYHMLDYRTIQAAMRGDSCAMRRIIAYYNHYMRTTLLRQEMDSYGNIITYVDYDELEELEFEYMEELLAWKPRNL